jgi:hypothetical protein
VLLADRALQQNNILKVYVKLAEKAIEQAIRETL